jgi:hypothetical protein
MTEGELILATFLIAIVAFVVAFAVIIVVMAALGM